MLGSECFEAVEIFLFLFLFLFLFQFPIPNADTQIRINDTMVLSVPSLPLRTPRKRLQNFLAG